jgi:hypothetical protein
MLGFELNIYGGNLFETEISNTLGSRDHSDEKKMVMITLLVNIS